MSIINNGLLLASGADAATTYQISRSLRFNSADSAYLSRTPGSAGNRKTWTWSAWVKRTVKNTATDQMLFTGGTTSSDTGFLALDFNSSDKLRLSSAATNFLITTAVYRDAGAWMHIVLAFDATQGTNANKAKLYVNGTEVTAFDTDGRSSITNQDYGINQAAAHEIGRATLGTNKYLDGYLADIYFLDGTATTPSTFAQTDAVTGQWVPKTPTGISYGTNGFRLSFSDNSGTTSTTLGKDGAGSNNWSPNNFSVASGSGNDSLVDSPTSYGTDTGAGGEVRGNYCTLNPLFALASLTLTNGNLETSSPGAAWRNAKGTFAMTTGKWYWEHTVPTTGAADGYIGGVATATADYSSSSTGIWGRQGTTKYSNGSSSTPFGSTTSGDILGFAFDADAGKLWVAQNGTWVGDPGAGTGESWSGIPSGVFPYVAAYNQANVVNFGQRAFAYTNNRSGFKALCDTNLPAPVVAKPSTVMDVKLYTGNAGNQTISGFSFSPDFIWTKSRSQAYSHNIYDSVRGISKNLFANETSAENTDANTIKAFNSDGFQLGSNDNGNYTNNGSAVAWCWDAGSSTVSNPDGSITSSVRANASAGFSVVGWNYPIGSPVSTIGHGLGVKPSFIIIKTRDNSSNWIIYHTSTGATKCFRFTTAAASTETDPFNNTEPTSSVFTIGAGSWWGGGNMIAYCFAPVSGYSSFGSYTGNGSTDGPFVYTGFRPKWILIKRTNAADDWPLMDTVRTPANPQDAQLYPNFSNAENNPVVSSRQWDALSNGFKIRGNNDAINNASGTYIYISFAENPFQYARAR